MNQLDHDYEETIVLMHQLKTDQYRMFKLTTDIAASVPDELTRISSF